DEPEQRGHIVTLIPGDHLGAGSRDVLDGGEPFHCTHLVDPADTTGKTLADRWASQERAIDIKGDQLDRSVLGPSAWRHGLLCAGYFPPAGRTTTGILQTSTCPAGTLNHSSRRLRRDSMNAVKVAVSVRNSWRAVRCDSGPSAATRMVFIGTRCWGLS